MSPSFFAERVRVTQIIYKNHISDGLRKKKFEKNSFWALVEKGLLFL